MQKEELKNEAKQLQEDLVSARRYLHMRPGTGFEIAETVSFVKEKLKEMGYEPSDCGKAGVVALAGGKWTGKTFLIRADMDGLPIREESGLSFASANGMAHACGHDLHTAMLLGAARLLKLHEDEIEGTVKIMFQPAEEIFEGAKDMVEAGVLRDPEVDAAMMIHAAAGSAYPAGTLLVSDPGVSASGADFFEIEVSGKGCHGSTPEKGVDPLSAAAHIVIALQEIHAREISMDERAVLTIGSMRAGTAANVIPDKAVMSGSIRTFDEEMRSFLKQRLEETAECTARAFRARAKVTFGSGCPALQNDEALSGDLLRYARELLGENGAFSMAELSEGTGKKAAGMAGSEDFAYVSSQVPSIMAALAAGGPENGYRYLQHHPKVKFDETILWKGSAIYAYAAMRWLEEHR